MQYLNGQENMIFIAAAVVSWKIPKATVTLCFHFQGLTTLLFIFGAFLKLAPNRLSFFNKICKLSFGNINLFLLSKLFQIFLIRCSVKE